MGREPAVHGHTRHDGAWASRVGQIEQLFRSQSLAPVREKRRANSYQLFERCANRPSVIGRTRRSSEELLSPSISYS